MALHVGAVKWAPCGWQFCCCFTFAFFELCTAFPVLSFHTNQHPLSGILAKHFGLHYFAAIFVASSPIFRVIFSVRTHNTHLLQHLHCNCNSAYKWCAYKLDLLRCGLSVGQKVQLWKLKIYCISRGQHSVGGVGVVSVRLGLGWFGFDWLSLQITHTHRC